MSSIAPTTSKDIHQVASDGAAEQAAALDPRIAALQAGGISLTETLGIALKSLAANKLRTLLTALGIIIGVAAVVALMAIGQGSQASITSRISANGANLLTVRSGASSSSGVRGQVGSSQTLTTEDAAALADTQNVPDAALISPEYSSFGQLVAGSQNANAQVTGAEPAYLTVHNATIGSGDFITDDDVRSASSVVVLGANVATTLFPDGDALGQSLRINGQKFTVVGVLASKGGSGFGSTDDGVIVPLATAQRKLFGGRAISGGSALLSSIAVQAKDENSVTAALDEINATLREQHNLAADGSADNFSVINQQDLLDSVASTTRTLTLFLGAIAAISLVVGGIGIMNIMLVSVRERTREIGLRKAIGAREGDILTQFMLEALTISLIGALIGLTLGVLIALAVNLSGQFTATPSVSAAALAVGFAMAIGLFFGIAPARSAARLDPIEALRYD
jgi:putative ABC transport system permease protein